ncbi:hypothetical protein Neosp_003131 [[Neocosmospora] mangrovei]
MALTVLVNAFVDCYRCWQHPGAPPEDFWGTQPDDRVQIPTADQLGLPYPEEEGEEPGIGADVPQDGPASGHTRTFSTETASTDPLQWDDARYEQATADVSSLAQRLENVQLQDNNSSDATPLYVTTYYSSHQRRVCFRTADGSEVRTREGEWESTYAEYDGQMVPCFLYTNESGQFYTWAHGTGDASAEGGKSQGKGKEKKRKDKKGKGHRR